MFTINNNLDIILSKDIKIIDENVLVFNFRFNIKLSYKHIEFFKKYNFLSGIVNIMT